MTDWIEWTGGDCPVAKGTLVDVEYRDGMRARSVTAGTEPTEIGHVDDNGLFASDWTHSSYEGSWEIVAYRLAQPVTSLLTTKLTISDAADWQELLAVMSEHLDELPEAVRSGLQKLADGEALVWGPEWAASLGAQGEDVTVEADGEPVERCQYGLPLRRCYRADDGELVPAASFTILHKGKVLAGW